METFDKRCLFNVRIFSLPVKFRGDYRICLLTCKTLREKQLVSLHCMLATSLPSCSLRSKESLGWSQGSRPTQAKEHFTCVSLPFGRTSQNILFNHFNCNVQETSRNISLWLGLSPVDTGTPDGRLMLQSCLSDCAVLNTDLAVVSVSLAMPGIFGAIEIWLIVNLNLVDR